MAADSTAASTLTRHTSVLRLRRTASSPSINSLIRVKFSAIKSKRGYVLSIDSDGHAAVYFGSTGVVTIQLGGTKGKPWDDITENRATLFRKLIAALDAHDDLDGMEAIRERLHDGLAKDPNEKELRRLALPDDASDFDAVFSASAGAKLGFTLDWSQEQDCVAVSFVAPDSQAARAGVAKRDTLVSIGTTTTSAAAVAAQGLDLTAATAALVAQMATAREQSRAAAAVVADGGGGGAAEGADGAPGEHDASTFRVVFRRPPPAVVVSCIVPKQLLSKSSSGSFNAKAPDGRKLRVRVDAGHTAPTILVRLAGLPPNSPRPVASDPVVATSAVPTRQC